MIIHEYVDGPQICYYLLAAGCPVDSPDTDRRTPLYLAVKHKLTHSIHTILDFGPSVDIVDVNDIPLFCWACLFNDRSVVFRLIQMSNGEVINSRTSEVDSPIFWACERSDGTHAAGLGGGDGKGGRGRRASASSSSAWSALQIVKLLVQCGAIVTEPSHIDGLLPYERAQQCGNGTVAEYLLSVMQQQQQDEQNQQQTLNSYYY